MDVEGEDHEDDFGELYRDVLQPFSSAETLKCESREEKDEVVGSVRLEIYLGSRRVLENSFVFSLGGEKKNGNHECGEMAVGRDELYSDRPPQRNSEPERDDEIGGGAHGTGRIISPDRPVSGSEEGELISDGYNNNNNKAHHIQNTRHHVVPWPRPPGPMVNRYPYLSSTLLFDLDLESLEYRHPNVHLSHYFNYGLNETSWKIYCHQLKSMRIYAGKQIQGEDDEPTATIQSVAPDQNKCYRTFLQGNNQQQQQQEDNNSKRPKLVDDESWSNMSDNEWMCRNDPIRHQRQEEEEEEEESDMRKKSSRKGRSKLERWTRHDRDENTSTSTSSPPPP